jgi:hypothetical protein
MISWSTTLRACLVTLAILLPAASGCDTDVIGVGQGGVTDLCAARTPCPAGAPQGQVSYTVDEAVQVVMTPKTAGYDGSYVVIAATAADGSELDFRIWTNGALGEFRCEDPATAERTRIDLTGPSSGYYWTTVGGGQCDIWIHRADGTVDGTFAATLLSTSVYPVPMTTRHAISGSFGVDSQTR